MKNPNTRHSRAAKFRGFYAAIGISLLMIGAACVFAYSQTSHTLEENLDSITEQMAVPSVTTLLSAEAPVAEIRTDVLKAETTTQPSATASTAPETEAPTETTLSESETPVHQLVMPLTECNVLNPFSGGELVKSETTGTWQTHNGVDLSCETGTDVFSVDTGTVKEVCRDALWGYTITIDHNNGVISRYCGLDGSVEVREGDDVQPGQKIGIIGNVPDLESALDTHLHLEIQRNGAYIDPMEYLK